MNHRRISEIVGAVSLLAMLSAPALAIADEELKATLRGFEEVPAISTAGSGTFRGKIDDDETSIEYELSYSDLEGGSVLFAHIHLGQRSVNGGVIVFLCSNVPVPVTTPACPTPSGTVTGTVTANDVIGPAGQGITAGEFAELLNAIREGVAYANVHTGSVSPPTGFPGGEIRGQIK
jgi:hypothetical protein